MLFAEFMAKLPELDPLSDVKDRTARAERAERSPFSTARRRRMSVVLVEQAEALLSKPLNINKADWAPQVQHLFSLTSADWRAARRDDSILFPAAPAASSEG